MGSLAPAVTRRKMAAGDSPAGKKVRVVSLCLGHNAHFMGVFALCVPGNGIQRALGAVPGRITGFPPIPATPPGMCPAAMPNAAQSETVPSSYKPRFEDGMREKGLPSSKRDTYEDRTKKNSLLSSNRGRFEDSWGDSPVKPANDGQGCRQMTGLDRRMTGRIGAKRRRGFRGVSPPASDSPVKPANDGDRSGMTRSYCFVLFRGMRIFRAY